MKNAIVYHWWTESCVFVKDDLFNPILYSIATIRRHNQEVPIYVINLSPEAEWGVYPKTLNFNVLNKHSKFTKNSGYQNNLMSRVFDIIEVAQTIEEEDILFNDSDVFWIKDPFPLMNDTKVFNCNQNNGVFYYNKHSIEAMNFIREWQHDTHRTVNDPDFRSKLLHDMQFASNFKIHDELIMRYTQKRLPDSYRPVPMKENNIIFTPITDPKNLHIIRAFVGKKDRLRVALSIKEIAEAIENVLGQILPKKDKYSVKDLITRKAIIDLCSDGDADRALNYCLSKIC